MPRSMTFEAKFDLIRQLWDGVRDKNPIRVEVSIPIDPERAVADLMAAIDRCHKEKMPASIAGRLTWLAADDSRVAASLLSEIAKNERGAIEIVVRRELAAIQGAFHE